MKNLKTIITSLFIVFTLVSCTKNDEINNELKEIVKNDSVQKKLTEMDYGNHYDIYFEFQSDIGLQDTTKVMIGNEVLVILPNTAETFADDFITKNIESFFKNRTDMIYVNKSNSTLARVRIYTNKVINVDGYATIVL